jgi:hypothetical protein
MVATNKSFGSAASGVVSYTPRARPSLEALKSRWESLKHDIAELQAKIRPEGLTEGSAFAALPAGQRDFLFAILLRSIQSAKQARVPAAMRRTAGLSTQCVPWLRRTRGLARL